MTETGRGTGQTALITGASAGIGVDLAECFASDGYDLVLAARTESALRQVADRLAAAYHVTATPIVADLQSIGGGTRLAADITARGLSVDVLVNNAGYGVAGAFDRSDATAQLGMIDLNDRALVELTHIYWPRMLANGRGGVLNVASTAAFQPGPLMAIYYASEGVRAVVLGSAVGRGPRHRSEGQLPLPGADREQVSRTRRYRQGAPEQGGHADAVDGGRAHGL